MTDLAALDDGSRLRCHVGDLLKRPARVRWIGAAVWVWSWYTVFLEVTRWKHVTHSFRFAPGPPMPGTDILPKPGLPLKIVFVCFFAAPLLVIVAATLEWVCKHERSHTPPAREAPSNTAPCP